MTEHSTIDGLCPAASLSTWAVVGATGFVGRCVLDHLSGSGDLKAFGVAAPRLTAGVDDDASALIDRLGQPSAVGALAELGQHFTGVDVVINAAGLAAPDSAATEELFGANALLPAVVVEAAARAGVRRVVHISSAAVQDRRSPLDESSEIMPVTPYARSKALGESAITTLCASRTVEPEGTSVTIFRATSVHGPGRAATERLARFAASRFSSVAGDGSRPTPVVSVEQLAASVESLGRYRGEPAPIVLAPWTGATTGDVMRHFGGREPTRLPTWLCQAMIVAGYCVSRLVGGRGRAVVRRVEVLWLGQLQVAGWLAENGLITSPSAERIGGRNDV